MAVAVLVPCVVVVNVAEESAMAEGRCDVILCCEGEWMCVILAKG